MTRSANLALLGALLTSDGAGNIELPQSPPAGDSSTKIATTAFIGAATAKYLPLIGGSLTGSLTLSRGGQLFLQSENGAYIAPLRADDTGLIGFINQANNAWNMQITDAGVVSIPRARPTWAGLTPWDSGNFNPTTKVTVRNAGAAFGGFVGTDTGNSTIIDWTGALSVYVDGQYQGNIVTNTNFGTFSGGVNGYQKFPTGLIIQWGNGVIPAGSTQVTWDFPIVFPNTVVHMSGNDTGSGAHALGFSVLNTVGFEAYSNIATTNFNFLAIGW